MPDRLGLRFDRRDERALRELADRAKLRELGEHAHATFALAASAAHTGEPLIVECDSLLEAMLMARGYVRFGIREPVIERLSGEGRCRALRDPLPPRPTL